MNILCYGDSNTWGYIPNLEGYSQNAVPRQYEEKDCWWFPLKQENKLTVNGLCGRCIAHENRWLAKRNASISIGAELKEYQDLALIIVQLGTNDCKSEYNDSARDITNNLDRLLTTIKNATTAEILIISPARIIENNKITYKYYRGAENKSIELNSYYAALARQKNYSFVSGLDLEVGEDGEHLTRLEHKQLGLKVLEKINDLNKQQVTPFILTR